MHILNHDELRKARVASLGHKYPLATKSECEMVADGIIRESVLKGESCADHDHAPEGGDFSGPDLYDNDR